MNIKSTIKRPGSHRTHSPQKPSRPQQESSAIPQDTLQMVERLEDMETKDLRKLAGVKKPGFFRRMYNTAAGWISGINLALALGPTMGHILIAKELSELGSGLFGKPELSPMDWLRENRPNGFSDSIGSVMAAGSGMLENAMGLSLTELSEVEEHYYRAMAPALNENGVKSTAPFLREMAKDPQQQRSAFVFLGADRADEAESVSKLWNRENRSPENPFPVLDPRRRIWESLESQSAKGNLPIFVDIDGDYTTFTGTEFVAKKTLSSLGERNNSLGDDFADTSRYFAWLTQRQESYSRDLAPYVQNKHPEASETVSQIKADLTPPWLDGDDGMGPWTAPNLMREMPGRLEDIKAKGEGAYLDSIISLDRDVLTGVQTHWIKLLRELKRPDRQKVLEGLPSKLFEVNLRTPGESGFASVAPADAPGIAEVIPHEQLVAKRRPYDRSVGLKEALDHTLDGLGVDERRDMLNEIRTLSEKNSTKLHQREGRLRGALGAGYIGADVKRVISGKEPEAKFKRAMTQLREYADANPRTPLGQEARRHASILEFLNAMEHRYGEVDQILYRIEGDFSSHPLGVSEYFIPPAPGAKVTPLRATEPKPVVLGNSLDSNPMKMSMVLEGGGGRGFAYLECLKQLENSFTQSQHGYEVDEYIGTSAGSLVAVLLAAGYQPDELLGVMESIDFTSFNADAAWLMGGVDPKVRGINRNGLFSTQKMYQTFHQLLSEKLGVEGRPVLFSDLPHKLKMVAGVMNTDLPEDGGLHQQIDGDGRFVFSSDSTPNFDVVGALVSSAAVPAFFQLPQILVAKPTEQEGVPERHRMQLADGGVIDNLSLSSASREEKERALVVLPAHTQTRDPETGEWVGLDTLNFSTDNLDLIDAHNKKLYNKFVPKLDDYFQRLKAHGVERAVLGFNLVKPWQQELPAVQGSSEELSLHSLIHAKDLDMPIMSKEDGDGVIEYSQRPPGLLTDVVANLFDRYIDNRPGVNDGEGDFYRDNDGFHFEPPKDEVADIFDMGWAAGSAALAASKSEYANRKFQQD